MEENRMEMKNGASFEEKLQEAVPKLTKDLSSHFTPLIDHLTSQMEQVRHGQVTLLQELSELNHIVDANIDVPNVSATLNRLPQYHYKLKQLRNTMQNLTSRSQRLVKRADALKRIRLEYSRQADEMARRERHRDHLLAARVAERGSPSSRPVSPRESALARSGEEDVVPSAESSPVASPSVNSGATTPSAVVISPPEGDRATPVASVTKPTVAKKKKKRREVEIGDLPAKK
ncbi:hypothetical protein BZG36_01814 [Bifiguratus adelaidae]|uniref:Uncharacterized protein n=1 Tax=Bifiguratus adelaidae TaxID=1938954 RepID=A0A261Y294_9FUNG|nr:hypothetical protein BZG36_01814 [Bifiguratus adelaidae]